jgi:hypothetical protein
VNRLLPAVVAAALLVPSPAQALEPERLPPGPLPGTPVPGKFGAVRDVRQLVATGHGRQRIRLLIARGPRDQLCVAAVAGARRSSFECLASWDHPPLIVRVGAGGGSRAKTNWVGAVGLVRADVAAVTAETDLSENRPLPLRGRPGFPWKAFAFAPTGTDLRGRDIAHSIRARDGAGAVLQRVDLGWADRPPCDERKRGCRTRAERRGRWSEARDPIASKEARYIRRRGGTKVKRIAFGHPAVAQIVAGQPFSYDGIAIWTQCNDRLIGGVLPLRLSRPITFVGDVPLHGYRNGSAYLEGVWHLRVENAIGFRIYVDLRRKRVVGISPDSVLLDDREGGRPAQKVDYAIVQPPRPVGRDSGDCESKPGD